MTARKVDVVGYLCTKLEDTNSTAMGTGLEAGTLRKILEDIYFRNVCRSNSTPEAASSFPLTGALQILPSLAGYLLWAIK